VKACLTLLVFLATASVACALDWSKQDERRVSQLRQRAKRGPAGTSVCEGPNWIARSPLGVEFTARAGAYMERMQAAWRSVFRVKFESAFKPTLTILASREAYTKLKKDGSRGFCDWSWDSQGKFTSLRVTTFWEGKGAPSFERMYLGILNHECSHALLAKGVGAKKTPAWLDEGVATFFQAWDVFASRKANLAGRRARSRFRRVLPTKPFSLRELAAIEDTPAFNPDSLGPVARRNYALSESLVDRLITGDDKARKILIRMLNRISQGKGPFASREQAEKLQAFWHSAEWGS
jgi:hypothetical protein